MSSVPIPKLPGYTVTAPIVPVSDSSFRKGQTLHYTNGYATEAPLLLVDQDPSCKWEMLQRTESAIPAHHSNGSAVPKWVEMDRKVLRFYGYFKESIVESRLENHRIRKVVIYYYLADDTMHIAEPKEDNSGLPQGVFIKRCPVKKPDGMPYTYKDIAIGADLPFFGRIIHIVDCDDFTRGFLEHEELAPSAAESYPVDPIDTYKATYKRMQTGIPPNPRVDDLTRFLEAKLGKPPNVLEEDKLKQFLGCNRKVLRFYCLWDDRENLYGDRRPYVLHYFLEDDTGELLDINEPNSGRDPFPVFLKRGPLLKEQHAFMSVTNRTNKDRCYTAADFHIGGKIRIENRDFFIFDCDDFTRNWYKENHSRTEEDLKPLQIAEELIPFAKPALPPHNGYGTLEDSQQHCMSLLPKPPKKNFHKLMNKDSIVLRFSAKLVETQRFSLADSDRDRKFIISYFMADDTISVYEPIVRNCGIMGGKFLERGRVFKYDLDEIYNYCDLYVGAVLHIHHRGFELLEADEYTYTYMENNRHVFVMSDTAAILKSLQKQASGRADDIRHCLSEMDSGKTGYLCAHKFETALYNSKLQFTRHQAIALQRSMEKDDNGRIEIEKFLTAIKCSQDE